MAERLRVLFFAEQFWPSIGGVEVLAAKLVRTLHANGHLVVVTTSHSSFEAPDVSEIDGVAIHRFRFLEALTTRRMDLFENNYRRLLRLRQDFRPDLVHVCDTGGSVLFHLRAQARERIPTLLGVQSSSPPRSTSRDGAMRRALAAADRIAVVSEAVRQEVERIAPEAAERCSVILNGLEMPTLAPAPLDFQQPRLLCVGRLVHEKGFDVAIRAFRRVQERFPGARLTIAGDGPARASLEALAVELGIGDQVDFPGWVTPEGIPALMNSATLVLMPSRWREAFGLVTLEAMQMARPVVATRVGGTSEVMADGRTGILVPSEDPASMAAAAESLLENPRLAAAMGEAGRLLASRNFSFETYYRAFESLYFQLAGIPTHDRLSYTAQPAH